MNYTEVSGTFLLCSGNDKELGRSRHLQYNTNPAVLLNLLWFEPLGKPLKAVAISQRTLESCIKRHNSWSSLYNWNAFFYALPQGVVTAESNRHGLLLEEPKTLLFKGNTYSLQVSIQDLPQFPWSIKPFSTCQVRIFIQLLSYISQEHCLAVEALQMLIIVSLYVEKIFFSWL